MKHTVNDAYPHPDQNTDYLEIPTMAEAVERARRALLDEHASMFTRRNAAFDLLLALEGLGDA